LHLTSIVVIDSVRLDKVSAAALDRLRDDTSIPAPVQEGISVRLLIPEDQFRPLFQRDEFAHSVIPLACNAASIALLTARENSDSDGGTPTTLSVKYASLLTRWVDCKNCGTDNRY
jgi:hypothetical protein